MRYEQDVNNRKLWCVVTPRYTGTWEPILSTLAYSKERAWKKFYGHCSVYAERRAKAGTARLVQCSIIIDTKRKEARDDTN